MVTHFSCKNFSGINVPGLFKLQSAKLLSKIEKITKKKWGDVSLVFVTPQRIKYLNSVYHHRKKVTDVLSFTYEKGPINGEVIICVKRAAVQAKHLKRSLNEELKFLFIHGCLHLQGFDHIKVKDRKIMEKMEDRIYND